MDTAPPFALYNPALLPPDVLLSEFTARRPLLARLLDIIRANDPGEPAQHVLCVGPRGMGKTTLLCAIAATIKLREPELAKHWQPVVFDEESRRIGDLADFWLECIRQWESETEPTLTRSHRLDALLASPGPDIEDKAREVFLSLVDASGKRALLLIDNLNDIFIAVNDAESLMRLRSFLMSDPRVMIIGAATRWFSDVTGLDKPFFEFFRPFDLHALSLEEMRECLAGVATARGDQRVLDTLRYRPGSIEVLHILTGGNPRLIRTFYRLLNEGMNGELRLQLERLIDDYTPYHKAIIDALPGQQQRVLDAIALEWNPTDVGTVARTTRLPSNQVSAQIKALIKAGLISEAANMGHSKKKAYLLTDRFSNIHYLMRHGRTGKLKMHWFVMMLRSLFGDKEFAEVAAKAVRLTAEGACAASRDWLMLAQNVIDYAGSETARREFMDLTMGSAEHDSDIDIQKATQLCQNAIASNPNDAYAYHKWGRLLDLHFHRYAEAEAAYLKATQLDKKFALPWNNLGWMLMNQFTRPIEAEVAFRKAIALDSTLAWSWNGLGILLSQQLDRLDEAETAYRTALQMQPDYTLAWHNLARLLAESHKRARQAEAAYRRAIELDPTMSRPWHGLGDLLALDPDRCLEAEAAYRKAVDLKPTFSRSWLGLGCVLSLDSKRLNEASNAYRKAIELEPRCALAWTGLGIVTHELGQLTDAEAAYRVAIELDAKDAFSHSGLAAVLGQQGADYTEAKASAATGFRLQPNNAYSGRILRKLCFTHPESLRSVLPEVSHWCTQHPDEQSVLSFMVDAWIAYAKVTSASEARELLDAQPDEVKLAFETVRDAFLAHDDKDHLHRLAPERRAPVLKLLERLKE